ncbi:metal-sulfur cluster assembly factor [Afipia birgiae]|jgi:metal-sulfur cluster biosynthetic enzyme|uniref:metal-sulfur cluster assembly factor n=1 Tax=Afipia birgiae TaxID=151414 RepID=UPI000317097E|nr:metal-sulfur cluster assembly factor [Afipia birgiae]
MTGVDSMLAAQVRDALRVVIDPELGLNVVDLGFVYGVSVEDGAAWIVMTATTLGCPATGFLKEGVSNSALRVPGVKSVDVTMTFDPPWTPALMTADARAELGFRN